MGEAGWALRGARSNGHAAGHPGTLYGGGLLGVPPFGQLARHAVPKLVSPTWWSARTHEWRCGRITLPLPLDVVKPDLILPHAKVPAGITPAPLPSQPRDLTGVRYAWAGREKTVAEFVETTATDAVLFVHNGVLVGEFYANGWSPELRHQGWSTTKSFVSTLVGIARDQKLIESLDDPMGAYMPGVRGSAWEPVTIKNVLSMRSGVHWDEHTEKMRDNTQVLEWVDLIADLHSRGKRGKTRNEFLTSLPRVGEQGTQFNYNSANTQILAWLVEELYGASFAEVLSEKLWKPAGMESSAMIMTDRTGAAIASQELFARPRDFARFGEVLRNGGRAANGTQVVSEAWIREATTQMLPAKDAGDEKMGGYGYQWWSGATPDGFQANGFQGQYITVSPHAGLTGVRLAHTLQFLRSGGFAGQGNDEWHAVFRAVRDELTA